VLINKSFRYRIYPNEEQKRALAIQFGHSRFVFNYFLDKRIEFYKEHKNDPVKKGLNYNDMSKMLTELKKDPDHLWLNDAYAQNLQQSLKNLDRSYKNFFHGSGFPKFKKKSDNQSIRYPQNIRLNNSLLFAPKVGWVKIKLHRPVEGKVKNLTIKKTATGKYFANFQCEVEIDPPQNRPNQVGIDLGIKDFAITSDGEVIPNPRFLVKAEKKIKRAQRIFSRRVKGSSGWYKAKRRVALAHEKVRNQRNDFLNKTSRMFVKQYGYIAIEQLNVSGMIKNHKLAKHISDVGWSTFGRQLDYKGIWYGSEIVRIGRFEPSSKTCSNCGYKLEKLDLSVREWDCPQCNAHHDRDGNAAKNILAFSMAGAAKRINAGGECVSPVFQAVLIEAGNVTPQGVHSSQFRVLPLLSKSLLEI
jgi:putative transposase